MRTAVVVVAVDVVVGLLIADVKKWLLLSNSNLNDPLFFFSINCCKLTESGSGADAIKKFTPS